MNLHDTPLDQIGSSAHGHYKVAEKAAGKAEEHYKSAGIYLKHAKLRVLKTRGLTWPRWLADHCPISKSRADEIIAISDGRMAPDHAATKQQAYRDNQKEAGPLKTKGNSGQFTERSADRSEKPNENNERQPYQQSHAQPDPVREAEDINAQAHADRLRVLKNRINNATEEQLAQIEGIFNV